MRRHQLWQHIPNRELHGEYNAAPHEQTPAFPVVRGVPFEYSKRELSVAIAFVCFAGSGQDGTEQGLTAVNAVSLLAEDPR